MTRAYNIDCMGAMAQMKDNEFDLAIVDPPYGIGAGKEKPHNGWRDYGIKEWDNNRPNLNYFNYLATKSKNQIIWGGNYMTDYLTPSMGWIVWDKGQREFSLADGELAFSSFDRALRIFNMPRGRHKAEDDKTGGKIHPTQKPIALYKWLLKNYAKEGDKILDTHLGSGSSRIAAHDMGFDFVGYEIDKDYFDAQEVRFTNHIKQQSLFQPQEMYQ